MRTDKLKIALFYRVLLLIGCLLSFNTAQAHFNTTLKYDSLQRQLPLQKTTADSVRVLQQLVDANPSPGDNALDSSSIDYLDQLLKLNKKADKINSSPYLLLQNARNYKVAGQYQKALNSLESAIEIFDKQHKIIDPLLISLRGYFNKLNDQEGRLKYYQQKLTYYQVNGPVENTAPCFHGIGGYYSVYAAYNLAISYYLKAAAAYRKFDPRYYSNDLSVVGFLYSEWGNDTRGEYYLEKMAIPLSIRLRNNSNLVYCYSSLSEISFKHKDYQKAINELDEGSSYINSITGNKYAVYLVAKCLALFKMSEVPQGLSLLNKAKVMADTGKYQLYSTTGELEIDYAFYEYNRLTGNTRSAEKYLLLANQKAQDAKENKLKLKYLYELQKFYTANKKPDLALKYYNQYTDLWNLNIQEQDKFKIAQYEIDQKDLEQSEHINTLKKEKTLQAYQISRRNTLLWYSLAVVILISALLTFIYSQLQVKRKTLITLRKTQAQLIQAEKMASLGELTAGIAHEIQNPLNFVNNFSDINTELLEEMQQEIDRGDYDEVKAIAIDLNENQQKIKVHGKRAESIVKGMLEHSRTSKGEGQSTNINTLATDFLKLSYQALRSKDNNFDCEMVTHFDPNLPNINLIPQDIGRALLNLFNNAFYAVNQKQKAAGEDYKPEVTITTCLEHKQVLIKIKDNGTGIPDAIKEKIMQPFFTTKPTGEGTGLGLSLTYDMVVKGHGGTIQVNSVEGEGSEFVISLPIGLNG